MTRTIPFAEIILLFSTLFVQTTANAGVSIIATVNGKPITNYDVEQRALFLGYATNIEITDQNRDRLYEDSLQLIIDDKLRLEAAQDMIDSGLCSRYENAGIQACGCLHKMRG